MRSKNRSTRVGPCLRAIAAVVAITLGGASTPGLSMASPVPAAVTEVKVERTAPVRPKRPTLRFLKENRDFLRAQIDRLREKPLTRRGDADEIDPRFLAYRDMLSRIAGAQDSVGQGADAEGRRGLFASVMELGELEAELDQLERQLSSQNQRLAVLERDFTGDQETELVVVISGAAAESDFAEVEGVTLVLEDGTRRTITLSDSSRAALRRGGVVQVFHGFVEPREQTFEVMVAGGGWPSRDSGFLSLAPARDRRTLLRLDLGALGKGPGVASIRASFWLDDTRTVSVDG